MKYLIYPALLLPILILSGCAQIKPLDVDGGDVSKNYAPITIYVEGDSTMFGSHPGYAPGNDQTVNNPPALLQAALTQAFPNIQITVENHAEPGSDTDDTLDGTDEYNGTFAKRMAESHAQYVITNSLLNDIARGRVPPDGYRENLTTWIGIVQSSGKIAILEEPNPTTCDTVQPEILQYIQIEHEVAKSLNVQIITQYDAIENFVGNNLSQYLQDCEHPQDALYEFKAAREAKFFEALINQINGGLL